MRLALWLSGLAAAVALALAANVLLLRTDGARDDPAGTVGQAEVAGHVDAARLNHDFGVSGQAGAPHPSDPRTA